MVTSSKARQKLLELYGDKIKKVFVDEDYMESCEQQTFNDEDIKELDFEED